MKRRTFIQQLAIGATGASIPRTGSAGVDVRWLRALWAEHRGDALRQLPGVDARIADGLGALSAAKHLEHCPPQSLVAAPAQALLHELAESVGQAVLACQEALRGFRRWHARRGTGEPLLRAGLWGILEGLEDWRATLGDQDKLRRSLVEVVSDTRPGMLLWRVRATLRRLDRVTRLSAQLHTDWDRSAVLHVSAPAGLQPDAGAARAPRSAAGVLGILVLGLGVVVGGLLVFVGGCSVACGESVGILVLLMGLAVLGLSISGLAKARAARPEKPRELEEPPLPFVPVLSFVLSPVGWVKPEAWQQPATLLRVVARGRLKSRSWSTGADGLDGASPAPAVAGFPPGALLGRLGSLTFLIGVEASIPPGPRQRLEMCINLEDGAGVRGHYAIEVSSVGL